MNRFLRFFCYCFVAAVSFLALTPGITPALEPEILAQWGVAGKLPGEIDDLRDIAVDTDGNVFLIDRNRLQKFTNDGTFVFSTHDGGDGAFSVPTAIASDQNNEIFLIDDYAPTRECKLLIRTLLEPGQVDGSLSTATVNVCTHSRRQDMT